MALVIGISIDHIRITVYYTNALIDNSVNTTLTSTYQTKTFQSDGSNWWIVAN